MEFGVYDEQVSGECNCPYGMFDNYFNVSTQLPENNKTSKHIIGICCLWREGVGRMQFAPNGMFDIIPMYLPNCLKNNKSNFKHIIGICCLWRAGVGGCSSPLRYVWTFCQNSTQQPEK